MGSGYPKGGYNPPMQQIPREKPPSTVPPWVKIGFIDRKHDSAAAERAAPLDRSARFTLVQTKSANLIKNVALIIRNCAYPSPESGQEELVWDAIDALLQQDVNRFRMLIRPQGITARGLSFAIVQHLVEEDVLVPVFTPTYQSARWQDGSRNLYMTLNRPALDAWEAARRLELHVND